MRTSLAPIRIVTGALAAQHGRLFPWVPVMLAFGIGAYFLLRWEPGMPHYAAIAAAGLLSAGLGWWTGVGWRPLWLAAAIVAAGFCLAGFRAHTVTEPVLGFRYYGPVEGRVVAIDRSLSNKQRVTLDRVVLARTDPARVPDRVRIALHGAETFRPPEPGLRVMLTAHLSPPTGPVEPGGFDFRRKAWFDRLGAVGYTRSPLVALARDPDPGWRARLFALRMTLSRAIQRELPGRNGGFAAAIITGDRSGVDRPVLDDLRASNLAHLLAISGLHMGLLTGFVFAALRFGIALVPPLALRVDARKLAAGAALPVAFGYLMISGAAIATERAFIMVAVMLVAILFDRRALTLRAVAMAAVIVLVLRPESLVAPGFQMSFAATTALVAVFGAMRAWAQSRDPEARRLPRWLRPVLAVVISSAVAGAATAPIGAYHFNQVSQYGLLANLVSVPVMGVLVMPAAVLALLLWPLGLAGPAFALVAAGIGWILGVAGQVAAWEGAVIPVVKPGAAVLPLLTFGLLVVILWQGRARVAGLVPALAALWLWSLAERPDVLISANGKLVGIMGPAGRVLNKPRGDGFAALSWLENDGDPAGQEDAAARNPAGWIDLAVIQDAPEAGPDGACAEKILVIAAATDLPGSGDCPTLVDRATLARMGAIALSRRGGEIVVTGARQITGSRLWNGAGRRAQ